ncbi:conserved hypothetical protein [Leishmania major strain Friedlin]|uniref:Tetratricopeptide repeat domain 39B n=1 Tax=Leishmania major TaxID=5664 RepID=Q4Q6R9_LEIMA|nr:conserved hypothetical protein [Leishmania major strain Friedlin]CAG9578611.1 Protein_of_unknown_function_(DUF3808)/Tetratricopeptide_repeat_-_putative [Leishmania major strain Friedlin]CAJ06903.1 conserved hypothetical protein [Leishmania major strain Friedlin]|eukprot:XP_001684979.1 conserved hypothetical protein [Leishmania major strain Friedlin]
MSNGVSTDAASMESIISTDGEMPSIHSGVEKAVYMMWNNEYSEALELLRAKKDKNPRYALEWANVSLVKTLMSSTNEDRERLLDLFKAADSLSTSSKYNDPMFSEDDEDDDREEDKTRKQLKMEKKKNKKVFKARKRDATKGGAYFDQTWKLECDVIYADALLIRSIGQLMMNSYLKGGINLRKAWGCYHSLIQQVEQDIENRIPYELKMCIKYGTGTFYAFLALVPANLMKVLSIIGFISDRDLGEQYLTEVFESNTIRSPFAALVLCTLYLFLPTGLGNVDVTLSRARRVLETMNARYPNNTYFNGYANFYFRKKGEVEPAVRSITLAAENAEKAGLVPLLIKYLYADTLFMNQQWAEALEQYRRILDHLTKTKEKFAYTGQVVLSVAACYAMLDNDKEALVWFKKVDSMYNPKSKNDSNSPRFANRVIANPRLLPLSGVYMLYINRDLAHMNKTQGLRVLAELKRVTKDKDLSGPEAENMYNLFVGVIEKGSENTDAALACMKKIFDNEKTIPSDSMILPFTYYETGEMEYRRGNIERAKELFDKGSKIKGDGNETLSNRYNIAMKQLRRAMADRESK